MAKLEARNQAERKEAERGRGGGQRMFHENLQFISANI